VKKTLRGELDRGSVGFGARKKLNPNGKKRGERVHFGGSTLQGCLAVEKGSTRKEVVGGIPGRNPT